MAAFERVRLRRRYVVEANWALDYKSFALFFLGDRLIRPLLVFDPGKEQRWIFVKPSLEQRHVPLAELKQCPCLCHRGAKLLRCAGDNLCLSCKQFTVCHRDNKNKAATNGLGAAWPSWAEVDLPTPSRWRPQPAAGKRSW